MDTSAKAWTLAVLAVAFIAAISVGASHLVIETIAVTGIGTPDEIVNLVARGL